jgi:hypothetical protein
MGQTAGFGYRYLKNQRMAKHWVCKTGCLEACQKGRGGLAVISWIQLRIYRCCRRGQKQLIWEPPIQLFQQRFPQRLFCRRGSTCLNSKVFSILDSELDDFTRAAVRKVTDFCKCTSWEFKTRGELLACEVYEVRRKQGV